MRKSSPSSLVLAVLLCAACASPRPGASGVEWAIAIHGGAGTLDRNAPAAELAACREALRTALQLGQERLLRGDSALDVTEAVVRVLEDAPMFNAGKGAAFNERGEHELDASIMDGSTLQCGAVAGVRTVRNPIGLARLVMEKTRHILLMGAGAEEFATAMGVERVPNDWFDTDKRRRALEEVLRERAAAKTGGGGAAAYGTVGCVVRDRAGRLAAATSTGGLTGKQYGRIGDAPQIGAGNYADGFVAVSGTGTGEQFIRHTIGRTVSARMQYGGDSLQQAAHAVVFETLQPGDGGIIAVDSAGNLQAIYNSEGMYRGVADSAGRFEVAIFEH